MADMRSDVERYPLRRCLPHRRENTTGLISPGCRHSKLSSIGYGCGETALPRTTRSQEYLHRILYCISVGLLAYVRCTPGTLTTGVILGGRPRRPGNPRAGRVFCQLPTGRGGCAAATFRGATPLACRAPGFAALSSHPEGGRLGRGLRYACSGWDAIGLNLARRQV